MFKWTIGRLVDQSGVELLSNIQLSEDVKYIYSYNNMSVSVYNDGNENFTFYSLVDCYYYTYLQTMLTYVFRQNRVISKRLKFLSGFSGFCFYIAKSQT